LIDPQEVIAIHSQLIEEFGGTHGLRDKILLDSALNNPFQTFDKTDLYPTIIEKSAALLEGLVKNHPFIDGNKRIAYFVFRAFLLSEDRNIDATQDEKYALVINVASGRWSSIEIIKWVKHHIVRL